MSKMDIFTRMPSDKQEETKRLLGETEALQQEITDTRKKSEPYAEELRKLTEIIREKEVQIQKITVNYAYICIS